MGLRSDRQVRWGNISKAIRERDLGHLVMNLVGQWWCGHPAPPNGGSDSLWVHQRIDGNVQVVSFIDDGGWVGFGTPDSWHTTSIRPAAARRMAAWILWRWAVDWFGLRSAIYYRALFAACGDGWRRGGTPAREHARIIRGDRFEAHQRIKREAKERHDRVVTEKRARYEPEQPA